MKFNYQAERIHIDTVYPKCKSRAAYRGKEHKDWYLIWGITTLDKSIVCIFRVIPGKTPGIFFVIVLRAPA